MEAIIIAAVQTVIITMTVFYLQRQQKIRDKQADIRAEKRKEESLLSMQMNKAGAQLSYAVAIAIKNKRANGEVGEAIKVYEEAEEKYNRFINEQATEHLQQN